MAQHYYFCQTATHQGLLEPDAGTTRQSGSEGGSAGQPAGPTRQEETANDQLKTHLHGPGQVLRSRLPKLVYQEIWAWLLVHHALSALISRAADAADLDPDRISFTRVLRITRRTATGTAGFPPEDWNNALPHVLADITHKINPGRRDRSCPRTIKRARHNSYRVKRPNDRNTRHHRPPTINIRGITPTAA